MFWEVEEPLHQSIGNFCYYLVKNYRMSCRAWIFHNVSIVNMKFLVIIHVWLVYMKKNSASHDRYKYWRSKLAPSPFIFTIYKKILTLIILQIVSPNKYKKRTCQTKERSYTIINSDIRFKLSFRKWSLHINFKIFLLPR